MLSSFAHHRGDSLALLMSFAAGSFWRQVSDVTVFGRHGSACVIKITAKILQKETLAALGSGSELDDNDVDDDTMHIIRSKNALHLYLINYEMLCNKSAAENYCLRERCNVQILISLLLSV